MLGFEQQKGKQMLKMKRKNTMSEPFTPNPRVSINHPLADSISIQDHPFAYAGRGHVEIAFFSNGEWVTDIIEEFAGYADAEAGDTRVYAYVPVAVLDPFMEKYQG